MASPARQNDVATYRAAKLRDDGRCALALFELARYLGLAARHDRDVVGAVLDGERQGVVGGGVAGVQCDDEIHPGRQRGACGEIPATIGRVNTGKSTVEPESDREDV